jgi:hypothetical protein
MASVEGGHPPVTRELEPSVRPRTAGGEVAEGETGCLPGRYGRERCLECRSRTTEPPQPGEAPPGWISATHMQPAGADVRHFCGPACGAEWLARQAEA